MLNWEATDHSTEESQECGHWKLSVHCLASECAENNETFSSFFDQTSSTSTVYQRWQIRACTKDHSLSARSPLLSIWCIRHERFVQFSECSFSIFIHKLGMMTGHPILLSIGLHFTTTSHSICSMLRIKLRLIIRSDHNRSFGNSISNYKQQSLA